MSLTQTDYAQAPPAPPNVMIIFGAGGDLTKRKLIPALFHLCSARLLPDSFAVLGLDRLEMDDERFRDQVADEIREQVGEAFDQKIWDWLVERIHYMKMDMLQDADYARLGARLSELDVTRATESNYLFYMAIPPSLFGGVTDRLGEARLLRETEHDWRRGICSRAIVAGGAGSRPRNSERGFAWLFEADQQERNCLLKKVSLRVNLSVWSDARYGLQLPPKKGRFRSG